MWADKATFQELFSPIISLREQEGEKNHDNGEEIVLESEERNPHPTDIKYHQVWQDATSLPNDPNAPTSTRFMDQTRNSNRKPGARGPTANLHWTNGRTEHEQAFISYHEHYLPNIGDTPPAVQHRSFQRIKPIASAVSAPVQQQQLVASCGDPAVSRNPWHLLGTTAQKEGCLEARAIYSTFPFAPVTATTFQSVGPAQETASGSYKAVPSVPMLLRPSLKKTALRPCFSAVTSPKKTTPSVEQLEDINNKSFQVSKNKEESKWQAQFKQFVSSQGRGAKREGPVRSWLRRQRKLHLLGRLDSTRQSLLAKYGALDTLKVKPFIETAAQKAKWMHQYEKLKKYHLVKGSFDVKNEDKSLHVWMKTQRQRYREWTEGAFNMPPYRIEKLEEIGFQWSLPS